MRACTNGRLHVQTFAFSRLAALRAATGRDAGAAQKRAAPSHDLGSTGLRAGGRSSARKHRTLSAACAASAAETKWRARPAALPANSQRIERISDSDFRQQHDNPNFNSPPCNPSLDPASPGRARLSAGRLASARSESRRSWWREMAGTHAARADLHADRRSRRTRPHAAGRRESSRSYPPPRGTCRHC